VGARVKRRQMGPSESHGLQMAGLANVLRAFAFIALGGLLFGYVIGITSDIDTPGQLLCAEDWQGAVGSWSSVGYRQCYQLGALERGLFSSLNLIGALLSSLFCFRFADELGRKLELQLGAALFFAGAVVAGASPALWAVYMGFGIYGLGIGFTMHAAPMYIAEISPADVRGTLVSAKEAMVVLGIFLGFLLGFLFSGVETVGWRLMVLAAGPLALAMGLGVTSIPQSPRFLVLRAVRRGGAEGAREDHSQRAARDALCFYRKAGAPEEVEAELQTLLSDITASVGSRAASWVDAFRFPRPLVIGCGLVFLQQVTGQPSVLYFATNIFKDAGFGSSAALSSVGVGLVKLLATLFTAWRVDLYGRRFLLFVGITMMAVALAVIGTAFLFRECRTPGVSLGDCDAGKAGLPQGWALATVAALMLYVSGYQVGFGPICWLMISEVFPVSVRGSALSVAAVVNFGTNIAVALTQEVLRDLLTPAGVFFTYLAMSLVSLLFVHFVVPETKGKTLEEIEAMLAGQKLGDDLATSLLTAAAATAPLAVAGHAKDPTLAATAPAARACRSPDQDTGLRA